MDSADGINCAVHMRSPADVAAVRAVARVRVVAASLTALAVSLFAGAGSYGPLQYLIGLAWVPAAGALAFAVDGRRARLVPAAGAVCDVAILAATMILIPHQAAAILVGLVAAVLISAYTGGSAAGLVAAVMAAGAVTLTNAAAGPADRMETSSVVLFTLTVGVALLVVDRALGERARADDRGDRYRERADAVLAHVADAVVVTDSTGMVIDANRSAMTMLQQSEGVLGGSPCPMALGLHVGERPLQCKGSCELLAMVAQPGNQGGVEVWRPRADGSRLPLLASAAPIPGPDDEISEVVHSLRDITKLKEADEAKTLFLASASHELKTPIAIIRGFLEAIANPAADAELRDHAIAVMRRRAEELTVIIDRLLLASRIEAGRVDVEVEPVDAAAVVAERVTAILGATGRTIELTADLIPAAIASESALATVTDHLIDNALKYSDGPVEITMRADHEHVLFAVRDHGTGMDSDHAARCFDKFWRANDSTHGSGVGLYIVRSLVEAMGGKVDVQSAPGQGSTFTIRLRCAAVGHTPAARPPAPLQPEGSIVREFMRQIGVPQVGGGE